MDASPDPATRITVQLGPRTAAHLTRLKDTTSRTTTDIVNHAISLYEFLDGNLAAGREILIRDNTDGTVQTVKLL